MLTHVVYDEPETVLAERIVSTVEQHGIKDPVYMMMDPGDNFDLPSEIDNNTEKNGGGLYITFSKTKTKDFADISGEIWIVANGELAGLLFLKYSAKIQLILDHDQMKMMIASCKECIGNKVNLITLNRYIRFCKSQHLLI